jgi:hypothetical protein
LATQIWLTLAESTSTATDLIIPVQAPAQPASSSALYVLILTTSDMTVEKDVEFRLQGFISAMRPANARDVIVLANDGSEHNALQSLIKLQILYAPLLTSMVSA